MNEHHGSLGPAIESNAPKKGNAMLQHLVNFLTALGGLTCKSAVKLKELACFLWEHVKDFPLFQAKSHAIKVRAEAELIRAEGQAEAEVIKARAEVVRAEAELMKAQVALREVEVRVIAAKSAAEVERIKAEAQADLVHAQVTLEEAKAEQMRRSTALGHGVVKQLLAGEGRVQGAITYADPTVQVEVNVGGASKVGQRANQKTTPADRALPKPSKDRKALEAPSDDVEQRPRSDGRRQEKGA